MVELQDLQRVYHSEIQFVQARELRVRDVEFGEVALSSRCWDNADLSYVVPRCIQHAQRLPNDQIQRQDCVVVRITFLQRRQPSHYAQIRDHVPLTIQHLQVLQQRALSPATW